MVHVLFFSAFVIIHDQKLLAIKVVKVFRKPGEKPVVFIDSAVDQENFGHNGLQIDLLIVCEFIYYLRKIGTISKSNN